MVVNSLCKYFNLPLKNWYPEDVPMPLFPELLIDCNGKSDEEIVREAVFHTYNIDEDDFKMRFSPSDFEKQRGDYPLRRELTAYTISLKGGTKKVQKTLENLGFRMNV
jgi:erythronate-4-phosphate dehydrogenase